MLISNTERIMSRIGLQFFAADTGAGDGGTPAGEGAQTATAAPATETPAADSKAADTVLSSEDIKKIIQQTVDKRTADLGKTISELKKENENLKRANMTAEQIAEADKAEFERQKAEVEQQKREIHAHRVVAAAGYGADAEAVVDIVLGDTDDKTDERLKNFKALVDKMVAAQVKATFKANGREPNGAQGTTETKPDNIAEKLGKARAEQAKQSNDILNHYIGGRK